MNENRSHRIKEQPDFLEFKISKFQVGVLALCGCGCIAFGVWLFFSASVMAKIFALAAITVGLWLSAFYLKQLKYKDSVVRLDSNGITDYRISNIPIKWGDIRQFTFCFGMEQGLRLKATYREEYLPYLNRHERKKLPTRNTVHIYLDFHPISTFFFIAREKMVVLINRYSQVYGGGHRQ